MYEKLLGLIPSHTVISIVFNVVQSVEVAGLTIGSQASTFDRSSYVTAVWSTQTGEIATYARPGKVDNFLSTQSRSMGNGRTTS